MSTDSSPRPLPGRERAHEQAAYAARQLEQVSLFLTAAESASHPDAVRSNLREARRVLATAQTAVGQSLARMTERERT